MGVFKMYNKNNSESDNNITFTYQEYGASNNGFAFAALVLGVCSVLTLFTVYLPLIFGSIAVILAILSKGYGKKMVTAAKVGFASALGSISFLLCFIGIVFFSIYIMLITYTPAQLTSLGRTLDQTVEAQTGMSTESIFGTSYEDIMEQISSLKAPQ